MSEEVSYTLKELRKILNEQQQRFCEAKLFNNNVQAYMIAYPDCAYSSASASATRLLEDVRIMQLINYLKNDIENITGVSKIRNVAALAKIAYAENNLTTTEECSDTNENVVEVSNRDRLTAMDLINKSLGYYAPTEQTVNLSTPKAIVFKKFNNE